LKKGEFGQKSTEFGFKTHFMFLFWLKIANNKIGAILVTPI